MRQNEQNVYGIHTSMDDSGTEEQQDKSTDDGTTL